MSVQSTGAPQPADDDDPAPPEVRAAQPGTAQPHHGGVGQGSLRPPPVRSRPSADPPTVPIPVQPSRRWPPPGGSRPGVEGPPGWWHPFPVTPPDWSRLEQPYPPPHLMPSSEFYPGELSAPDELTDESLVRQRRTPPTEGWRLAVYALSAGRINPGLSPLEAARIELIRRVRRPLPATHRIAVVSVKGGVGKTTVAACLGLVFAELRGDRVVALDANPDAGTLSERLTGPGGLTVRDLYEDIPNLRSVAELTRYTRPAGRLHVLGSEQEPAMGEAFTAGEYLDVCDLLGRFYNIIITDSGTGMVHSAMEATLATADSLVVVGSPTVDGANRASKTLAFLAAGQYRNLAEQALVVLCGDRHSPDVDRTRIRAHFAARCRAVIDFPPDPHLATGGRIDLSLCRDSTRDACYLAAAYLADGFGAAPPPSPRHPADDPAARGDLPPAQRPRGDRSES